MEYWSDGVCFSITHYSITPLFSLFDSGLFSLEYEWETYNAMKILKVFFCLIICFVNCISTMETARISHGMRYCANFEYSKIKPQKSSWTVQEQNPHVVGFGFKISHGRYLDKRARFTGELGLDLDVMFYPSVVGIVEYDNRETKSTIHYYPRSPHLILAPKVFARFGIFQNQKTSLAGRIDTAGDKLASAGMAISTRIKRREIYTGFKVFDRFIKSPERTMFNDRYGEYYYVGIEIPTEKRFYSTSKIYHLLIEIGIVNHLWYADHPTFCISTGFVIK